MKITILDILFWIVLIAAIAVMGMIFHVAFTSRAAAHGVSTACLPGQLKSALAHVSANYGRVIVVSAHRRGARIAGTGRRSKHADCRAVDFHVKGNRAGALKWLRRQPIEIITYGGAMHHIHIATGSYRGHHVVNGRGARKGGTRYASASKRRRYAGKAPAVNVKDRSYGFSGRGSGA